MKKNRILAFVLVLALIIGVIPVYAASAQTFTDVPPSHWAYADIQAAAADGVINGVGNNCFNPEGYLTIAEWSCIMARAFYPEGVEQRTKTSWYNREMDTLTSSAVFAGLFDEITDVNAYATRALMATMIGNMLPSHGVRWATTVDLEAYKAGIADLDGFPKFKQDAIAACYALGILNGVGDNCFDGNGYVQRGAAAAVYNRTKKAIQNGGQIVVAPTPPPTPTPVQTAFPTPEPTPTPTPSTVPQVDFSPEYMSSKYYRLLQEVTLTGNYREDLISVASSQIGYCEGNEPNQLDGAYAGNKDYTEYGRYMNSNGTAWCSEFASWCARVAGVPTSILKSSRGASVNAYGAPYYDWSQTVYAGGGYTPRPGDLALFAWTGTSPTAEYLSHTAIVYSVEAEGNTVTITVIDGNSGGLVRMHDYEADISDGAVRSGHLVYFVAPNYD